MEYVIKISHTYLFGFTSNFCLNKLKIKLKILFLFSIFFLIKTKTCLTNFILVLLVLRTKNMIDKLSIFICLFIYLYVYTYFYIYIYIYFWKLFKKIKILEFFFASSFFKKKKNCQANYKKRKKNPIFSLKNESIQTRSCSVKFIFCY